MATVTAIMLGGKRAGKSSVLAGVISSLNSPLFSKYIGTGDDTDYSVFPSDCGSVADKRIKLENFIETQQSNRYFTVDMMADDRIFHYDIYVKLPGQSGKLTMRFYDVPGEAMKKNNLLSAEVKPLVNEADIFIIAIDTPFLMQGKRAINHCCNRIDDVKDLLSDMMQSGELDSKLILFVPIKCEYWALNNQIYDVTEKVKSEYAVLLDDLKTRKSVGIMIMPILTAGGIVYDHMKEAMKVVKTDDPNTTLRYGSLLSDKIVRLTNGDLYPIKQGYEVVKHNNQAAYQSPIPIPLVWYKVIDNGKGYAPELCEQPALHILKFLIYKTVQNKKAITIWDRFLNWWDKIWKGLDYVAFESTIQRMDTAGLIHSEGNGFEVVKKLY